MQPELLEERVNEELGRWLDGSDTFLVTRDGVETILDFWRRQETADDYKFLPKVAKMVYAVPASSAQIERDFGICSQLLTTQRTSVLAHNLDMCAFLNRNKRFVDITQCARIEKDKVYEHIPSNVLLDLESDLECDVDELMAVSFSE